MYWITKILVFILVFACLIVIKEGANFFLVLRDAFKNEGSERKLNMTTKRLIILACAISYIFTIIFTGFKLF